MPRCLLAGFEVNIRDCVYMAKFIRGNCRHCGLLGEYCECVNMCCSKCVPRPTHCNCAEQKAALDAQDAEEYEGGMLSIEQRQKNVEGGLMSSGMHPDEAGRLARLWWNSKGRFLIRKDFNQEMVNGSFRASSGVAPAIKVAPVAKATLDSGILKALVWEELSRQEKANMTVTWHETKIMGYEPLKAQEKRAKRLRKKKNQLN